MIENDWDKIREKTLKLVCDYRDTYAGKEWKCREPQEKNGQIRTEIERIFKYIQSSSSELSWFQGKVSDDILSNYIADWITKKFTHRNLLSQQNFKGMYYDFTSLIAEHESVEDYCKDSDELNSKVKIYQEQYEKIESFFAPQEMIGTIQRVIKSNTGFDYSSTLIKLQECSNLILQNLLVEKQLPMYFGLEQLNYVRITEYMKVAEFIIEEILYSIIITFCRNEQEDCLKDILRAEGILDDEMDKEIARWEKESYQIVKINQEGKRASLADQAYVLRQQYKAYAEESTQIEQILEKDIDSHKSFFENPKPFHYGLVKLYSNKKQLIRDLKENDMVSGGDYKRFEKAKRYIDWANLKGEAIGDKEDVVLLRIVYREIFMNKVKLLDKSRNNLTSYTIVEKCMTGEQVEKRQGIFLDKKILRGRFREYNILLEYKYYNRINQKYRRILNKILNLPNDELMYEVIHAVLSEMLKIIGKAYMIEK